jgi:hypothetical protein
MSDIPHDCSLHQCYLAIVLAMQALTYGAQIVVEQMK